VQFPNGTSHEVAVVRHPPSVVLIPIDDQGKVVVIRQYRPSVDRLLWELPAGSLEPGETAEAAAVRECEEETGLVPRYVERLTALYPTPGFCDEELIFFRVSDFGTPPSGARRPADDDEDIEPQAFSVEELRNMVHTGIIVDLKTAYGLTLI
jgi:ADP-ribose pyrophosphatase